MCWQFDLGKQKHALKKDTLAVIFTIPQIHNIDHKHVIHEIQVSTDKKVSCVSVLPHTLYRSNCILQTLQDTQNAELKTSGRKNKRYLCNHEN